MDAKDDLKVIHSRTGKEGCVRILQEMEFRCMNSCLMNYELSRHYDDMEFNTSVVSSVAAGLTAIPAAKILPALRSFSTIGTKLTKLGTGILFGATTSSVAYSKASDYLLPSLRTKTTRYNQAGAGWQRMQLDIRGFLATSDQNTTTIKEYRDFIDKCAEKREEICNIARPTQWSYDKYNSTCQHVIDKYKRKTQWHMEFRRMQKETEEAIAKMGKDKT